MSESYINSSDSDTESNYEVCEEVDDEIGVDDIDEIDLNINLSISHEYFSGKDGFEWTTKAPTLNSLPNIEIYRNRYGTLPSAQCFNSISEFFNHFLDDSMLQDIVLFTNKRLLDDSPEIHLIELRAFIGLLLLFGITKKNDVEIYQIWEIDSIHHLSWATATMSCARFKTILSTITFDDIDTRSTRSIKEPKLHKISEIFTRFRFKIATSFEPGENLTIDETLYPFRGRCSFKQYMPKKPAKYGIKYWSIVDVATSYLLDTMIYSGKPNNASKNASNVGENVVLEISKPYYHSGRCITIDNFFTTISLAQSLWLNGLKLVGTLRKNKTEIPPELLPNKNKCIYSNTHVFSSYLSLVSYVPRKNKAVLVLSTYHHMALTDYSELQKPDIILFYNKTKGGVDTLDRLVESYTVRRKTNKWTVNVFMYMLDVAAYNAYVLYCDKNPAITDKKNSRQRKELLEKLALELLEEQIIQRFNGFKNKNFVGIRREIIDCIQRTGICETDQALSSVKQPSNVLKSQRSRCNVCPRVDDQKTSHQCCRCNSFICSKHSLDFKMCKACYTNILAENEREKSPVAENRPYNLRKKKF